MAGALAGARPLRRVRGQRALTATTAGAPQLLVERQASLRSRLLGPPRDCTISTIRPWDRTGAAHASEVIVASVVLPEADAQLVAEGTGVGVDARIGRRSMVARLLTCRLSRASGALRSLAQSSSEVASADDLEAKCFRAD